MEKIEIKAQTEIVAKRRAIEQSLVYFDKNEKEYFIKLKIKYNRTTKGGNTIETKEKLTARREIMSQYLGVEVLVFWRKNKSLKLDKYEYLQLWEFLKAHQNWETKNFLKKAIDLLFNRKKVKYGIQTQTHKRELGLQ